MREVRLLKSLFCFYHASSILARDVSTCVARARRVYVRERGDMDLLLCERKALTPCAVPLCSCSQFGM